MKYCFRNILQIEEYLFPFEVTELTLKFNNFKLPKNNAFKSRFFLGKLTGIFTSSILKETVSDNEIYEIRIGAGSFLMVFYNISEDHSEILIYLPKNSIIDEHLLKDALKTVRIS